MASQGPQPTTALYEPLLPPYHPVSSTDHGAYVLVATVIMLIVSGLAVGVKLQATMSKFKTLRWDDVALLTATVCLLSIRIDVVSNFARFLRSDTHLHYVEVSTTALVAPLKDLIARMFGC